ncbi:MAG TPA: NAD-dependent epimerase/dehydratase family protein [Planctomycetes bacterium]|nr:NAD-dependent epimerase/dehydratase family protein [Fuerstiella sp.]HIK94028.1 NAD-dependent epimerase/dehydratase family protein [Planctomycetota bacterium]
MANQALTRLIAGCGYLGLPVAEQWLSSGCDVVALTRSPERADDLRRRGLTPVVTDLASGSGQPSLSAADVVLWAVGFDRTAGVAREDIWLRGLERLLNRLPSAPQRFLYVSSTSVYGQDDGQTVDESTPPDPKTEGGQCCVAAEQLLRQHCGQLFPETQVVILRMAGIYGPGRLLRRVSDLQTQKPLPVEPDQWLNLIHVHDAVRMVDLVSSAVAVPPVINVVNSGTVTRRQYYARLAELVSAPAPVFEVSTGSARQRGGNKRVVSQNRANLNVGFAYDDVLAGLEQAVSAG